MRLRFASCFGAMALIAAVSASTAQAARVWKFDLGRHDNSNGFATSNPDARGNHWNNLSSLTNGPIPLNTTFGNLVTTANEPSALQIKITSGTTSTTALGNWEGNGYNNGGLINPNPVLLGDFALETATRDYWFTLNATGQTFDINGLDPQRFYSFRMFGSRVFTEARVTRYTLTGANSGTAVLQTTGTDIGTGPNQSGGGATHNNGGTVDGNDRDIASIVNIQPTASGTITFKLERASGGFAYLNIMEITEGSIVPEPASLAVASMGGLLLKRRRR